MRASFPNKVWDGTSPSRQNLQDVKTPDDFDYKTIVTELAAMQEFLIETLVGKAQITALRGPIGPEGKQGIPGERGPVGPEGKQGIPGERGPVGPEGKQGIPGERGPEGKQGERGPRGEDGGQGPRGERGAQGVRGFQGPKGEMTKRVLHVRAGKTHQESHGFDNHLVGFFVYVNNKLKHDACDIELVPDSDLFIVSNVKEDVRIVIIG